jgi:hypothetical protein
MSTNPNPAKPLWLPPPGVQIKDASVNIRDCHDVLHAFLVTAGIVHMHLFNRLLCVERGRGPGHAPGDIHWSGRAIDLEMVHGTDRQEAAFLAYLDVLCDRFHCVVIHAQTDVRIDYVHIEMES